jgi:hypothetical protein
MTINRKIVLLVCYFGKLPWYFDYFLHSCKYNIGVDFCLITDNKPPSFLPSNVRFIKKTIKEFENIAIKKFGFQISIDNPYKLCDFKPTYGFLFPELIEGYDFWGCGDIDVIFGRIRNFISDELLNNYDTICVRHDFITGYFMLFKNNKEINELFKHSKDYKKVFSNSKHFCFDETNFAFLQFEEGISYDKIQSEIESMTQVVKKLNAQKKIRAYFDFHVIEGTHGKLKWDKGTLTYKNKFEVVLYHLIRLKTVYIPKQAPRKIPDIFYISPTRIYS